MPTAIPAASPRTEAGSARTRRHRAAAFGRNLTFAIVTVVAWGLVASEPVDVLANGASGCSGWHSLTEPPTSIRVLRRRSGNIVTVPFRKYVVTVMGKEWPKYLPRAVVEAGAVATKQYAWYHAVYSSRTSDGRCYDVRDGVSDQLYKPGRARIAPELHRAVDVTWGVTLRKNGQFLMTGYRRGDKVRCGRDATGYKLLARSAVLCARKGYGWREILETYYGPGLTLLDHGTRSEGSASAMPGQPSPPETGVTPTDAREQPAVDGVADTGAIGGAASGGCGTAIARHEQLGLLRPASNSVEAD